MDNDLKNEAVSAHVLHMPLEKTLLRIDHIFLKFESIICNISLHIEAVFYKLEKVLSFHVSTVLDPKRQNVKSR